MDHLPEFKCGELAQIMNTTEMDSKGLGGKVGIVQVIDPTKETISINTGNTVHYAVSMYSARPVRLLDAVRWLDNKKSEKPSVYIVTALDVNAKVCEQYVFSKLTVAEERRKELSEVFGAEFVCLSSRAVDDEAGI